MVSRPCSFIGLLASPRLRWLAALLPVTVVGPRLLTAADRDACLFRASHAPLPPPARAEADEFGRAPDINFNQSVILPVP